MNYILLIVVLTNLLLYKSLANPVLLQSILWTIYYFFLESNIDIYDIYMKDVSSFIIFQCLGFSLGGFVCHLFTNNTLIKNKSEVTSNNRLKIEKNLILAYPYLLFLLSICILRLLSMGESFSWNQMFNLRETLVEDDGKSYGFFGTMQYLFSIYIILYLSTAEKILFKFKLFSAILLFFTLLLNSKGAFLFLVCPLLYAMLWQKKISKFYIIYSLTFLLGIFLTITLIRFNEGFESEFLFFILLVYTVTSMPALALANIPHSPLVGSYTFRIVYLWLNKIGFSFQIPPVLAEFTATPLGSNTYSYVKPYFYDFGMAGVFIIPMIIGFITQILFYQARKGQMEYLILTSLLIYSLLMQIFDEQYFQWLSNWVYFSIFIFVFTKIDFSKIKVFKPIPG